jgi:hypothetical protein
VVFIVFLYLIVGQTGESKHYIPIFLHVVGDIVNLNVHFPARKLIAIMYLAKGGRVAGYVPAIIVSYLKGFDPLANGLKKEGRYF